MSEFKEFTLRMETCPVRVNGELHCDHTNGTNYNHPAMGKQTTDYRCCFCGRDRREESPMFGGGPVVYAPQHHGPHRPVTTVTI